MGDDALIPGSTAALVQITQDGNLTLVIKDYLADFLSNRTREAYEGDFRDFGAFITKTFGPIFHPKDVTKTHVIASGIFCVRSIP